MSDELSKAAGPFDVETVSTMFDVKAVGALVKLMKEFDISEIDLKEGGKRMRLRRGARVATTAPAPPAQPVAAPAPAAVPASTAAPAVPAANSRALLEIKSELVGTFYAKPGPDKDDYVKVGSRVSADTVVCKVEAMKIFNDITAKVSGSIEEVCVQNGAFVEYDQVLFRVNPG